MRILRLIMIAALALALSPTSADAQRRGRHRSAQAAGKPDAALDAKRAKVRQRIHALRAWRLTEALDLDDKTAAKLFPILNRYDATMAAQMKEGARLRKELRALVKAGGTDQTAANELVDRMAKHQRQLWSLEERRFAEVRAVLTPVQAATILVVLPQIDRSIQREIGQVMRKAKARRQGKQGAKPQGDRVKNPFDEAGKTPAPAAPKRKRRAPPSEMVNPF